MTWRTSEVDLLRERWADGYSASLIAEELDISRNAVIGKVNRLGLPKRDTTKGKRPCAKRPAKTTAYEKRRKTAEALMTRFVTTAAKLHDVSLEEVMSDSQVTHVIAVRWRAIKMGRAVGINKTQIANFFDQDRQTIVHACKKMGVA